MKNKKLKWYFHIHHDILLEPLIGPLENRIKFIKEDKPKDEIELRLKLLKSVKGKLPEEFDEAGQNCVEAGQKWDKAGQKYDKAWQKYKEAWQKYVEARQKYKPQIEALHKKECPNCPWDSEQQTIFPKT